ncbi:MAG: class D beta-lactamase [Bacteroidota bacterium]
MNIKTYLALLLVTWLNIHQPVCAQQPEDKVKATLNLLMDQWHNNAATGNFEAYTGAMSRGGVYIGTDATEHWTTAEFSNWCKPWFDRGHTWSFKAVNRHIYLNAELTTAWFDEVLTTQMGLCRGSGVISKQGGEWKIEQYVLSPTVPNELMKGVTEEKRIADSILVPYIRMGVKEPAASHKLQALFDKYRMTGTILITDTSDQECYGYNPARWDSGYLPASTFKIVNTLIGLETGATDTTYVFPWKGEARQLPEWERNLKLREAFSLSCVPCYQELARKIGSETMNTYLAKLGYGSMDVHPGNIDRFWLEGRSRITPRQQADFIRRLYRETLPLSYPVMKAVKSIMVIETTDNYRLSGKTGWAVRDGNNYGWFVGYLETGGKVYFVATLVEPREQKDVTDFAAARKLITMEAFRILGFIGR